MEPQRMKFKMKKMVAQLNEDTLLKLKCIQTHLQGIRHRHVSIAEALDLVLARDILAIKIMRDNNINF